ncbi:MAG: methyltransferase family protein [Candidatus Binataceae bacterium]
MDETPINETATGSTGGYRIHPPLLAAGLLVGTLVLHSLLENGDVEPHELLGLLLVAGGIGISFYAAAIFQARDTTRDPFGAPSSFVVVVPYTFTRNPMYLGITLALLGFAVFFGSVVMLLAPIGFFVALDRIVIPNEEASMERQFGQQYLDYKARVRRWL